VDSIGTVLGPITDFFPSSAAFFAYIFQDPYVVHVSVRKNRVQSDFLAQFQSTDCTGNPVIDTEESFGIPFDSQMITPATVFFPSVVSSK
jgi:hypothetical protein